MYFQFRSPGNEREVIVSETYTRERTWVHKAKSEAQCGNFNI